MSLMKVKKLLNWNYQKKEKKLKILKIHYFFFYWVQNPCVINTLMLYKCTCMYHLSSLTVKSGDWLQAYYKL